MDFEKYSRIFKALSNSNRVRIFSRLAACCPPGKKFDYPDENSVCVGELGKDLCVAPSTVSHHIKELNRAGLINMERSGQNVKCWVDESIVEEIKSFFNLLEQPSHLNAEKR
jgi:ArsR family transcriptional regulator